MEDMNVDRKADSEAKMIFRMGRGEFRFRDLWIMFGADSPEYREADRLIQNERKAGRIKQLKHGVWIVVEPNSSAGKDAQNGR